MKDLMIVEEKEEEGVEIRVIVLLLVQETSLLLAQENGGKSILRCGCANAGPFPILGTQGLIPSLPIPVGSVTIDTCNLCKPSVLITANLLINTPAALLSSLTFRIVKCVDGCSQSVGGSFTFSDAIEALSSSSFTFSFCDFSSCNGCVTYSVEVTSATLLQAGTTVGGTISALAVENLC